MLPVPEEQSSIQPVAIDRPLLEAVYREARASYPNECCGWLAGPRVDNMAADIHPHPTVADRTAERAYVFSARDLLELNRTLDDARPWSFTTPTPTVRPTFHPPTARWQPVPGVMAPPIRYSNWWLALTIKRW